MRGRLALLLAAMMLVAVTATGCSGDQTDQPTDDATVSEQTAITVTDLLDRDVEIPTGVEHVIAIGPGSLRLLCYAGAQDMVVGVEEFESREPIARPYLLANPELLELPVIGVGGPDSAPDAERLVSADPDVIFVAQLTDTDSADELQAATGVPVVALSYGALGNFNDDVKRSLDIVGEVTGTTERTDEVISFIEETLDDLAARTSGVGDDEKASAYIGALGFKGMHGIESTQVDYPPFSSIGAASVTADLDQPGSIMIDKEQLLEWDPDYIFLDLSGVPLVEDDVATNGALYEGLTAVESGRVNTQIPFNNYWTNIEIALADSYFAGAVLFPDEFADVEPAEKLDEISQFMLGAPMYDTLVDLYGGGFDSIDLLANGQ